MRLSIGGNLGLALLGAVLTASPAFAVPAADHLVVESIQPYNPSSTGDAAGTTAAPEAWYGCTTGPGPSMPTSDIDSFRNHLQSTGGSVSIPAGQCLSTTYKSVRLCVYNGSTSRAYIERRDLGSVIDWVAHALGCCAGVNCLGGWALAGDGINGVLYKSFIQHNSVDCDLRDD